MPRTEKDFWVEMSIREIWTQAHFAELAFARINPMSTDETFSSIHSFLSHCAMVSKMLQARNYNPPRGGFKKLIYRILIWLRLKKKPSTIGSVLGVAKASIIHKRRFRNHLEHNDERLRSWIRQFGANVSIGLYNIGPKTAIHAPGLIFISHYDNGTKTFTFVNEDFNLQTLFVEVSKIKSLADGWVKSFESGSITPPFI